MKKILQLVTALFLIFNTVESRAQITNGTLSPDWTFTDIYGHTQNLYSYLNAGKTVVIDISAAWCHPCWLYHESGALDTVWADHGPLGDTAVNANSTNDMMVFFVEGELTNQTAQLYGIQGTVVPYSEYSDLAQGNWVAGVYYPIIDLSSSTPGAGTFLYTDYNLHYFPTCIMICPDRTMTEIDQWTASQIYTQKGMCSIATNVSDAEMLASTSLNPNLTSCDSVIPNFLLGNVGTSNLTSCTITYSVGGTVQKVHNWTGNLATYANTTVTGVKVGSTVLGSNTVTAVVSNPNGVTDPTPANNTSTAPFIIMPSNTSGGLVDETFETSGIPNTWLIGREGSYTWENCSVGYMSSKSMKMPFYNSPSGYVNYFVIDPMSFVGLPNPQLYFEVSYGLASATASDKLEVDVSTNCGASWQVRYVRAGSSLSTNGTTHFTSEYVPSSDAQWRMETVSLSSYVGHSDVLIRFKATSSQGNDLYVDNINVTAMPLGITELTNIGSVNVFPNPASNSATVNFNLTQSNNVSITLFDAIGQQVMKSELGNLSIGEQNYTLNTEKLSNGLYFLTINAGSGTVTRKITINK